MEQTPPKTLEELIQRELSKLPERTAPESLITRVVTQIQARQNKRWWQRPWTQWPVGLQLASWPLLIGSMAAAVFALSVGWRLLAVRAALESLSEQLDSFSVVWDVLGALGNAGWILARAAGQEWLFLALLVPVVMYAACVGLGTLCYRMAYYKRSTR